MIVGRGGMNRQTFTNGLEAMGIMPEMRLNPPFKKETYDKEYEAYKSRIKNGMSEVDSCKRSAILG